jgi:hypothetical protein
MTAWNLIYTSKHNQNVQGRRQIKFRTALATTASCAALALFVADAGAQTKPKLDANGGPHLRV